MTKSGDNAQASALTQEPMRGRRKSKDNGRLKKQRKMFLEQEEFRKWKRKISVANLLAEPVAQEAIGDLWTDLIARGPQWQEIYSNMHEDQDPFHTQHQNKPTTDSPNQTKQPSSQSILSSQSSSQIDTTESPIDVI